jgi:hypothetical protein
MYSTLYVLKYLYICTGTCLPMYIFVYICTYLHIHCMHVLYIYNYVNTFIYFLIITNQRLGSDLDSLFRPKHTVVAFRGHTQCIRIATFASEKPMAARCGLYLGHPWTDFGHFFNFENPITIFYKFYSAKLFAP